MNKQDNTNLIVKVAQSVFAPYGIIRKGKTRTWLDDNKWFTTIIELQPSNWLKGTYMNIGVNFHWFENDYFSFDIGGRFRPFEEFTKSDEFEVSVQQYCQEALHQIEFFRNRLKTKEEALKFIEETQTTYNIWGNYHLGIINALNKHNFMAQKYFNLILENEMTWDWVITIKKSVERLLMHLERDFAEHITEICISSRDRKKLPFIDYKEMMKTWS